MLNNKWLKSSFLILFVLGLLLTVFQAPVAAQLEFSGEFTSSISFAPASSTKLRASEELLLSLSKHFANSSFKIDLEGTLLLPRQAPARNLTIALGEAYFDYYGTDFDLRLGNQRFNWGTALQINPTSFLNPINLENPLGKRKPVYAINADYYFRDNFKLTGVISPFFSPAIKEIPGQPQITVEQPALSPKSGDYALKFSALGLGGFDFSLSYLYGKEKTPTPLLIPGQPPKAYYRDLQVIGADLATTLGDFGLWAEAAYSIPKDGPNYLQAVVGGDYGFSNGLIVMSQYIYQQKDNAKMHLFLAGLNQNLGLWDWQLGAVLNLKSKSMMLNPEVNYSIADGVSASLGARWFFNKNGPVGLLPKEENMVYFGLKTSF